MFGRPFVTKMAKRTTLNASMIRSTRMEKMKPQEITDLVKYLGTLEQVEMAR